MTIHISSTSPQTSYFHSFYFWSVFEAKYSILIPETLPVLQQGQKSNASDGLASIFNSQTGENIIGLRKFDLIIQLKLIYSDSLKYMITLYEGLLT